MPDLDATIIMMGAIALLFFRIALDIGKQLDRIEKKLDARSTQEVR